MWRARGLPPASASSGSRLRTAPLDLARHPNVNVRFAAAHSLALTTTDRSDDADARAALAELLNDPDEDVRGWAAFGLETLSVN